MNEKYKGFNITIEHDPHTESPNSWEDDNGVIIVTTHNRYFDVTPKDWDSSEILAQAIGGKTDRDRKMITYKGVRYHVRRLYMYRHSGTTLSLTPFSCPWDSGTVGVVLVKVGVSGKSGVTECAQSLVDTWNMYLSDDVWHYSVETQDGALIDSCGGCYGYDYTVCEAHAAADAAYDPDLEVAPAAFACPKCSEEVSGPVAYNGMLKCVWCGSLFEAFDDEPEGR